MIRHNWVLCGGYAVKRIRGVEVVQFIVAKYDVFIVCCFRRRDEYADWVIRQFREIEARERRRGFAVVSPDAEDERDPSA
jgi:hypothetical protein